MPNYCDTDHFLDATTGTCIHCINVCAKSFKTRPECIRLCPDYLRKTEATSQAVVTSPEPGSDAQTGFGFSVQLIIILFVLVMVIAVLTLCFCCVRNRHSRHGSAGLEESNKSKRNDKGLLRQRWNFFVETVANCVRCTRRNKLPQEEKGYLAENCKCAYHFDQSTTRLEANSSLTKPLPSGFGPCYSCQSEISLKDIKNGEKIPSFVTINNGKPTSHLPPSYRVEPSFDLGYDKKSLIKSRQHSLSLTHPKVQDTYRLNYAHHPDSCYGQNKLDAYQSLQDIDLAKVHRPSDKVHSGSHYIKRCAGHDQSLDISRAHPDVSPRLVNIQGTRPSFPDSQGYQRQPTARSYSRASWSLVPSTPGDSPPVINLISDTHNNNHHNLSDRSGQTFDDSYRVPSYHIDSVFSLSEHIHTLKHKYPWIIGQMISNDHLEVVVDLHMAGCTLQEAYNKVANEISQNREQLLVITPNESLPNSQI